MVNMYEHEVLVEQIFSKRDPAEILQSIRMRGLETSDDSDSKAKLKKLQDKRHQDLLKSHSFYFDWLKENSIVNYECTTNSNSFFTFAFKNDNDAIAFKLRWC